MKSDTLTPLLVFAFSTRLGIFQVGKDFVFELSEVTLSKMFIFKKFLTRSDVQKGSETLAYRVSIR